MNAVAIIEPAPIVGMDDWIARGRGLADQRRDVDWKLGDWLDEGKAQGYLDQAKFDFLSENLGIAPKRLRDIAKAVEAFPPAVRDRALSIDHHVSVAGLERQHALRLLVTARAQHWTPERTRAEAQQHGSSDDPEPRAARDEDALLESFWHHWNRLPRKVRLEAAERIADANGDEIEP